MSLLTGLALTAISLPFMDYEVIQLGGKSFVLPYLVPLLLAWPLGRRADVAIATLRRDLSLPWLFAWLLAAAIAALSTGVALPHQQMLVKNVTQLANMLLMTTQYVLILASVALLTAAETERLVKVVTITGIFAALFSLLQVGAVMIGAEFPELFRTSNLYFRLNTLDQAGGGGWAGLPRAFGAAPEPSFWGAYLATCLAFTVPRALTQRVAAVATLLLAAAIVVTFARGTWVTVVLMGGAYVLARWRRSSVVPALAVLCVSALLVAGPLLIGENSSLARTDYSAIERISTQRTAVRMFTDHPIIGVGLGSIEFLIEEYAFFFPGYTSVNYAVLHNWYLTVLVATGLVGFALFAGFVGALFAGLHRTIRRATSLRQLEVGFTGVLSCVAVAGFWINTPAYNMTFLWFALAFAAGRGAPASREVNT